MCRSCEGFRRTEGNVQHSVLPSFLAIFLPLMSAPNRTSFNTSSSSLLLDENRHRASAIAPKSSLPISLEIEGGMSQSTHGQKQRMGEKKKKSSTQNDSNSYVSGNGRKQQLVKVSTLPGRGLLLPPSSNAPSLLDYAEDEREEDAMLLTQYHDVLEAFWLSPQLEADLIRDLLFVFQGITGKYIRYDPRSESYIIDPSLSLRAHIKDLILCLCELGWLYSRVDGYIQQAEKDKFRGLVTHAFGFALQEELHDYYRLLAVLEQELGRKLKGIEQENKERGGSAHPGKGSFGGLTLIRYCKPSPLYHEARCFLNNNFRRRLKAWVQEPLERMVLMARLVDSAAPLSGGALSSRLYGHCKHGDPMVHAFTLRLMTAVNNPYTIPLVFSLAIFLLMEPSTCRLNAMLTRWLLHGELQDIHHEFFITDTQSAMTSNGSSSGHAWHSMFRLRLPMLPSFIPLDLANKILTVGKSISFIRVCIENLGKSAANGNSNPLKAQGVKMPRESIAHAIHGNKDTREDFDSRAGMEIEVRFTKEGALGEDLSSRTEELGSCLEQLTSSEGRHRLDTLIGSISSSIDAQLLHLMESRFYLSTHLASLKKFMLLGQGDFVTCLMDAIAPELKKKASLLYRHNLTGMLEGALRSSNAQFEASYVLERVGVRLLVRTNYEYSVK